MLPQSRLTGLTVRPLEADEAPAILREATLGNVNWQGPRFDPAEIDRRPEFAHYTRLVLERGDFGVVAMPIATLPTYEWAGAAWALHLPEQDPGYGFVAEGIPEVSLHVLPQWRNRRVGRMLLHELHEEARRRGLSALSLSVESGNPARQLYESMGYREAPTATEGTLLLEL